MVGLDPAEGRVAVNELMKNNIFSLQDEKIVISDMEQIQKQTEYYRKMTSLDQKREKSKLQR